MRITVAAIGKLKTGPERDLLQDYLKRLPWKVTIAEHEVKKDLPPAARKSEETRLLQVATSSATKRIALDERGRELTSREWAKLLGGWRNSGESVAILIGGADGLDKAALPPIDATLAFGRMTWPHMLVRVMLSEQLYRAWSILEGHPYHRD